MCAEIASSFRNIKRIIPNITELTSTVVDVAYEMQQNHGNVNLRKDSVNVDGVWMGTVAVNGITKKLHVEDDCTYTVVYVPAQEQKGKLGAYNFQIALDKKHHIAIPLLEYTTMIFSGKSMTHRQTLKDSHSAVNDDYINFVAYGDKKLFCHLKKSFLRNVL